MGRRLWCEPPPFAEARDHKSFVAFPRHDERDLRPPKRSDSLSCPLALPRRSAGARVNARNIADAKAIADLSMVLSFSLFRWRFVRDLVGRG